MPSKKSKASKPRQNPQPSTAERSSAEAPSETERLCELRDLPTLARELALQLRPGDRVLLEGQMGAGKTTFSRFLLEELGIDQPPEGSPSFAIAHEYHSRHGEVVHLDFYRIRHESEIDEAGIPAYFWEREAIVICEWLSSWPEFEKQVMKSGRVFEIGISLVDEDPERRRFGIRLPSS